ncbi:MAG TPA: lysophospholipid acyltransferase family protein [Syntrophales bacterium]|nr:lysophospholipid acyltransferase family protein [Syntrophales bacterium]
MIRAVLFIIIGVAITAFMSACAVVFAFITPDENVIHRVANIWARMLLILTSIKVEIIGAENISKGSQIFMANHQSDFDIFIVLAHLPGQFRWIVKKELFNVPLFGKAMRNAGYIEIDRQNRERAMQSLDQAARKIREGKSVMSFPEGTRSRNGKIKPFKQGMFYLAIKSGVPIVPISIIGAGEIMPKRSLLIKPGKITMVIDKPIDVSEYTIENRQDLIERVQNIITRNCEEIRSAESGNPAKKSR